MNSFSSLLFCYVRMIFNNFHVFCTIFIRFISFETKRAEETCSIFALGFDIEGSLSIADMNERAHGIELRGTGGATVSTNH